MRRRYRSVADVELPANLRFFNAAEWAAPGDSDDEVWVGEAARRRWGDARGVWCEANKISPLDLIRRDRERRRAAQGGAPPG